MATNFKEMWICLMILIKASIFVENKILQQGISRGTSLLESNTVCLLSSSRNKCSTANKLILFFMIFRDATCIRRITDAQQKIWFKIPFSLKSPTSY